MSNNKKNRNKNKNIKNTKKIFIISAVLLGLILLLLILPKGKFNFIKPHNDEETKLADTPIYFNSSVVAYDNTNSDVSSNTVQSAIDELYNSITSGCYVGYTKGTTTSTQYTCNKNSTASSAQTNFSGSNVKYDNSSGLTSTNVQSAIDELVSLVTYCDSNHHKENETSNSYDCLINITQCEAPTNVSISAQGIVTWTASSNCSEAQHQISIDGTNFVNASSGIDYNAVITATTGSRTVYVKSLAPSSIYSDSDAANQSTTVYSVSLTKGTGVDTVTGAGNYISGSSVTLDATFSNPYYWLKWTDTNSGTDVSTTQAYTFSIEDNVSLTANVGDGCASGNTTTTTGSYGACSNAQCSKGTRTRTITTKSTVISGYVCSTRTESRACAKGDNCWWYLTEEQTGDICGVACPTMCDNRGASNWQCLQTSTTYKPYSQEYWGTYCWCKS